MFPSLSSKNKGAGLRIHFCDTDYSSLQLYRTVHKADHSVCLCFGCLPTDKCYSCRRLISSSRCGCHGLHVDTRRFGKRVDHCSREGKVNVCLVCMSCLTAVHAVTYMSSIATFCIRLYQILYCPNTMCQAVISCSAPRQFVSASPLLPWLLSFVELG